MERVTPTGAAILRMLDVALRPLPALRIVASGYGAGGRDTPGEPNLLRLLIGEAADPPPAPELDRDQSPSSKPSSTTPTPQLLAYVSELLLAAGAWDVYRVAVQMKKGRTGVQLTVLCAPISSPLCATSSSAKPPPSACTGASKTRSPWPASSLKSTLHGARSASRSPAGPSAKSPTPRPNTKTAAPRRRTLVPLKQVMQEAMRRLCREQRQPLTRRTADGSPRIETLLNEVREGRTGVADALDRLRDLPFEDIGFAKLDHHRALRTGMPESSSPPAKPPPRSPPSLPAWPRPAAMSWPPAPPRHV